MKYREQFDLCVSRAVANIATLCEYCIPFVKVGGSFIAYKSGNTDDDPEKFEKAVNELGGEKHFSKKFVLNGEFDRSFICISKSISTPEKYPRRPGIPGKRPII